MSVIPNTSRISSLVESARPPRLRLAPIDRSDLLTKAIIVFVSGLSLWLAWEYRAYQITLGELWRDPFSRAVLIGGVAYGGMSMFWSIWRLILAVRYRPVATVTDDAQLPSLTVVVPAFNEGALVYQTLRRLADADYPRDKMQIIVVDDGSDDDTWSHISAAAAEIGPVVTPIHCSENRGKRWALWEGFRRGTGEVFVTVDSDSLIERNALREVVSPMVRDEQVGGVAGNVRVLNRTDALIPRMLAVRYVMTFDYKRAAQSMMAGGTVLCVAGALAAYRRTALMPVLDEWLHQTYLGGPARAGEDHAMTNFINRQGFKVVYQQTAHVHTKSPATYPAVCKMFLRWARSNIRETVHSAGFMFTPFKQRGLWGVRFNFLMIALNFVLPYLFMAALLMLSIMHPLAFGLKFMAAFVTGSMFTMLFYLWRERDLQAMYAIPYAFYSGVPLLWIGPYALMTSHKSVWLTRNRKAAAAGPETSAGGEAPVEAAAVTLPLAPALARAVSGADQDRSLHRRKSPAGRRRSWRRISA